MNRLEALGWLCRKVAWGLSEAEWDRWKRLGPASVIDELVGRGTTEAEPRPNPFTAIDLTQTPESGIDRDGVEHWMRAAVDSPRPLETFMEFFWHDYFAVSARVVRPRPAMFDHMNLLARHQLGNFRELLQDITIDAAMLSFLDGRLNRKDRPNENYARELLELYSVGVENFTEQDVQAASRSLTGWTIDGGQVNFVPGRHDPEPQTLLGVDGVNDVATTVNAVLSHPATAPRTVGKLAGAILGPTYDPTLLGPIIEGFASDWEIRPVVAGLLELGVEGHAVPSIVPPVAWYVTARRLPTVEPTLINFRRFFRDSAQMVLFPPNVGGFPDSDAYLSASATVARFNLASHLAESSIRSGGPVDLVALTRDVDRLALRLGLVNGFRATTHQAIKGLPPGPSRLTAALASPDLVVI